MSIDSLSMSLSIGSGRVCYQQGYPVYFKVAAIRDMTLFMLTMIFFYLRLFKHAFTSFDRQGVCICHTTRIVQWWGEALASLSLSLSLILILRSWRSCTRRRWMIDGGAGTRSLPSLCGTSWPACSVSPPSLIGHGLCYFKELIEPCSPGWWFFWEMVLLGNGSSRLWVF